VKLLSNQLQAFFEVAQSGTVHEAAKRLGLTQTAITQRILSLEKELGNSCFIRSRKGMALTSAGKSLLQYCKQSIELEGFVLAKIKDQGATTPVKIVIQSCSSVMRSRIIPQVLKIKSEFPLLTFEFKISDTVSGVHSLKAGDVDIAIIERDQVVPEFESKLLRPESYYLVGPKTWLKRDLKDIVKHEQIIDFDLSDQMTFTWLKRHGYYQDNLPERHFVNNTSSIALLVEQGLGYSVLSEFDFQQMSNQYSLADLGKGKKYTYDVALAWCSRPILPSYLKKIISLIK